MKEARGEAMAFAVSASGGLSRGNNRGGFCTQSRAMILQLVINFTVILTDGLRSMKKEEEGSLLNKETKGAMGREQASMRPLT